MDVLYIIIVLVVIFVSMTLHELAHGLVANSLGDRTAYDFGRLTLNPIKHIDPYMTILLPMIIIITNMATGASVPIFGGAKPVLASHLSISISTSRVLPIFSDSFEILSVK